MCGITAVWGEDNPTLINKIMDSLTHRGPDDSGTASWENATLGHRRLSIMDPKGGQQPLFNEDKQLAIVANGEIYNFKALKASLLPSHQFATSSDSEVPLHLYEQMEKKMAQQLDGMFAFILSDGQELVAVRDPVGIKPLYYGKSGNNLVFCL